MSDWLTMLCIAAVAAAGIYLLVVILRPEKF